MPEVGILSAIGLALEEQWGKVPLTANQVGKTAAPMRFMTVEPDGGFIPRLDMSVPTDEVDGSPETRRSILQSKDYEGGFQFKVDAENMIYPCLGVLGRCVQSALGSGSGTTQV